MPGAVCSHRLVILLIPAVYAHKKPGNLALCRFGNAGTQCLGWLDINRPFDDYMKVVPDLDPPLNWRFEDGLLKAVGDDGYASDLCLGPNRNVTFLKPKSCVPYELVLQDCPLPMEQLSADSSAGTSNDGVWRVPSDPARHMKFRIDSDGRVKSLAPVLSLGKDLVTDSPYCVTTMQWKNDKNIKTYLIPCIEKDYNTGNTTNAVDALQNTTTTYYKRYSHGFMKPENRENQEFHIPRGSTFDSFLLPWVDPFRPSWADGSDSGDLKVAFQIGNGPDVTNLQSHKLSMKQEDGQVVSGKGGCNNIHLDASHRSGILSLSHSDFGRANGRVEMELIAYDSVVSERLLASTLVVVPNQPSSIGLVLSLTAGIIGLLLIAGASMCFYRRNNLIVNSAFDKNGNALDDDETNRNAIKSAGKTTEGDRNESNAAAELNNDDDIEQNTAADTASEAGSEDKSEATDNSSKNNDGTQDNQ